MLKGFLIIDVGMGLNRKKDMLNGMLRATCYSAEHARKIRDKGLAELKDTENDLYRTNVQISELNALNACLAMVKFKHLRGYYFTEIPHYHLLFEIGIKKSLAKARSNEDFAAACSLHAEGTQAWRALCRRRIRRGRTPLCLRMRFKDSNTARTNGVEASGNRDRTYALPVNRQLAAALPITLLDITR